MHKICLSDIIAKPDNSIIQKNNSLDFKFWFMLSLIFLNDSLAFMFRHLYNFHHTFLLASDGQTDTTC